jgi:hypothetical protein
LATAPWPATVGTAHAAPESDRNDHAKETTESPASGSALAVASKARRTFVWIGSGGSVTAVDGGAFATHAFEMHRVEAGHSADVAQVRTGGALDEHATSAATQEATAAMDVLRDEPRMD